MSSSISSAERVVRVRIDTASARRDAADINRILGSIGGNLSGLRGANDNLGDLTTRLGGLGAAGANASGKLGALGSVLGLISTRALVLTGSLVGLGAAFLKVTAQSNNFADKMAEVSTLVDTSSFNMDKLTNSILSQSVAFGKNPVESAGAAYQIISAGASDAQSAIETMNQANMLAVGGVTDVFTAADGLTSVMNAYGPSVLSAGDASNSMFVAMKMGKTTIGELASSLGQVAPLAAQTGVSFDELNASVAALTKGGVSTSIAVTGLRAILAAVAKPTTEAQKMAKSLGLEFDTTALKTKGFAGFLQDIKQKTGGSTDALAQLFGGVEALVPMLALSGQAGVDFSATMEEMKKKGGAAEEAYNKIAGSPGFQLARVFSAMKVAAIDFSSALTASLVPVLKFVADNFMNTYQVIKVLGLAFAGFKLASFVSNALTAGTALTRLGAIAETITKVIDLSSAAMARLNIVMLANPYLLIAAAIGAVIGLLYEFSDKISAGTKGMATLADVGHVVWDDIKSGLASVGEFFSSVWNSITGFVSAAWNKITTIFSPITEFFSSVFGPVVTVFETVFSNIDLSFMGFMRFAARVIDIVINIFRNAGTVIANYWSMLPQALGAVVGTVANGVITGVNWMVNEAIKGINKLIDLANNIPKVNIGHLSEVQFGKFTVPKMPNPTDLLKGTDYKSYAEKYVNSVADRADARAAARNATGGGTKTNAANDNSNVNIPSAASDAASKAKKDAESALEKYNELIQKMKDEIKLAGMLSYQAEIYNKQLEAKKILGKAYTDEVQGKEIANLMREKNVAQSLGQMKQQEFELSNQALANSMRKVNAVGEEAKIQDALTKYRLDALNKGEKISDITSDQWKLEEQKLAALMRQNDAFDEQIAKQQKLIQDGKTLVDQYSRAADPKGAANSDYMARYSQINAYASANPDGLSPEKLQSVVQTALKGSSDQFASDLKGISQKFKQDMTDGIKQLGDALGGELGKAVNKIGDALDNIHKAQNGDYSGLGAIGGIAKIFGKNSDGTNNSFGDAFKTGFDGFTNKMTDIFKNPISSLGQGFKDFKAGFSTSLSDGLGKALGGAAAGAQIGSMVGSLGGLIDKKFDNVGTQIGGAVGSVFGPVGSVIGAIGGGILGALFAKRPRGSGTVSNTGVNVSTNDQQLTSDTNDWGKSIQDSVSGIASDLGGTVGNYNIGIGRYKEYWQVSTQAGDPYLGNSYFHQNSKNDVYDGTDPQQAMAAAVVAALKNGAIQGVSDFSSKILKNATASNLEQMVNLASMYENVSKQMGDASDGIVKGAQDMVKSFDDLISGMKGAGATTAELAKVEDFRQTSIDKYISDATANLTSLKDKLLGTDGGATTLSVLTRDLDKFKTMQADIQSGKMVDQTQFTNLGQNVLQEARAVYGTTGAFVDIRNMLLDATNNLIGNTAGEINAGIDPTTAEVQQVNSQIGITNDLLRQINQTLQNQNSGSSPVVGLGGGGGGSLVRNGLQVARV